MQKLTQPLQIMITPEMEEAVLEQASREHRSKSGMARALIRRGLKATEMLRKPQWEKDK